MNYLELQLKMHNDATGEMDKQDGYNCDACKNKGFIFFIRGEEIVSRLCECRKIRKSIYRLKQSGIEAHLMEKTLDSFKVVDKWQSVIKSATESYLKETRDKWFFIGGQSGSGKTHLCTAICMELMKRGKSLVYMQWLDASRELKSASNELYFGEILDKYKDVDVLYIDDFFKVRYGDTPTNADIKIAFELLNSRLTRNKVTIISSEFTLRELCKFDEATMSRINEKAKPYVLAIERDKSKNYRL